MLAAGVALSAAGFSTPPVGEISDSVLWVFAQCLLYAGGIFGVRSYVDRKMQQWHDTTPGSQTQRGSASPTATKV